MKLPFQLSLVNLLLGAAPLILIGTIGYTVYNQGYRSGAAKIQAEWNEDKLARQAIVDELNRKNADLQAKNLTDSQKASEDLADANQTYARAVAGLDSDLALRLRDSEDRAGRYKYLSQASSAERDRLAIHAAELDRSLEQSRSLVKEFRATLEQRDATILTLGQIIRSERQLMGQNDGREATATE